MADAKSVGALAFRGTRGPKGSKGDLGPIGPQGPIGPVGATSSTLGMLKFSGFALGSGEEGDGISFLSDSGSTDSLSIRFAFYPIVLGCELENLAVLMDDTSLSDGSSIVVELLKNTVTVIASITYSSGDVGIRLEEFEPVPFAQGDTVAIRVRTHGLVSNVHISATVGVVAPTARPALPVAAGRFDPSQPPGSLFISSQSGEFQSAIWDAPGFYNIILNPIPGIVSPNQLIPVATLLGAPTGVIVTSAGFTSGRGLVHVLITDSIGTDPAPSVDRSFYLHVALLGV